MIRVLLISPFAIAVLVGVMPAHAEDRICGARCVHRILECLNKPADLTDIIEELYDSPQGGMVSFEDLAEVLRRHGVSTRAVPLGTFDIPAKYPVILHVNGNHFVVGEKGNRWSATVWDGVNGSREIPWWSVRHSSSEAMLVCSADGLPENGFVDSTYRLVAFSVSTLLVLFGALLLRLVWTRLTGRRRKQLLPLTRR